MTTIRGGDGHVLLVLPLKAINRAGLARFPEANATIKLCVE